ncbi:S-layer homology domain-containing protein [Olsenella sp. An293]|uniref:S-layer homology domain-containing protein n=1 Tax=Olsenella sp. An293 TaxID=1965626 RepID=UPI000B375CB3|nr:S-layer homology domain-containing protein [Olsenella sp. An293]OUO31079.1 hypothetical protein B5F85_10350 [Olsenella sp. An293]
MTACTNNGGKARRVVTAALVGVLSVGAVPAIALATGTGDVSLQSVQPAYTIEAEDGQGLAVEYTAGKTVELTAGTAQYLEPVALFDSEGNELDLDEYVITYLDEDGNPIKTASGNPVTDVAGWFANANSTNHRTDAGTDYTLVITKGGNDILKVKFTYVTPSVEGVYAYENGDVEDTTFVYDGTDLDIRFADGDADPIAYTLQGFYTADGTWSRTVKNAGSYTAVITVNGERVSVPVEVSALDLTTASVVMGDTAAAGSVNTPAGFFSKLRIGGFAGTKTGSFEVASVSGPSGSSFNGGRGEYTVTIEGTDPEVKAGNITGSATVSYYVLTHDVRSSSVMYYGANVVADGGSTNVSLADGESFDASKVKVEYAGKTYKGDDLELTFTDRDGKKVDASALSKPGTYKVDVRLVPFQNGDGEWVGACLSFDVNAKGTQVVANAGLTYTFDGKVVADNAGNPGVTTSYTGSDLMERVGIEVKDEDGKVYERGTDYTVTIKKGNKTVDSIVNVGEYKITVTPVTFESKGGSSSDWVLTVKVNPMTAYDAKVVADVTANGTDYLAYTGEVLEPSFTFTDADGNAIDVPADAFVVTYLDADGDRVDPKDEGVYKVTFRAAKGIENYAFDKGCDAEFTITKKGVFLDVPANEWYSQAVYDAAKLGYMNGDGGKLTFSPMRELTRAEAACVLFNMAGGDKVYNDVTIPGYNPNADVYETGFSDVEGNEFFAKAVAWAKATGIVNGYADGTFGVSRKVTSEEFACMLANFEKAKGGDVTVDADAVLAEYSDKDAVSDWAKDSVAWAVSEGVMGNGPALAPAGSILRMRVATMVVNYQPEPVSDMVIDPGINSGVDQN